MAVGYGNQYIESVFILSQSLTSMDLLTKISHSGIITAVAITITAKVTKTILRLRIMIRRQPAIDKVDQASEIVA